MPSPRPYLLIFLLPLIAFFVSGCSKPPGQALLEDYLYRMGNATEQPIDDDLSIQPPVMSYPPRRERLVASEDIREGLLDTLNLRACNLLPLIAERNSSLGKVMPVSQQLIYELRFYVLIRDCLSKSEVKSDQELFDQVDSIYQQKKRNLPVVLWNAIYNAPEMEANFSLGDPPLSPDEQHSLGPAINSLQHFQQLIYLSRQEGPWELPVFLPQLEKDYEVLNRNRFGARWLTSIRQLTLALERSGDAINARLARRSICPLGKPTPQAKILNNVFRKYYIGQVQPYMALVHQTGTRWLAQHETLLGQLTHSSLIQAYQQRMLSTQSQLWLDYINARDEHTKAWQTLLGQCGLMPSRN